MNTAACLNVRVVPNVAKLWFMATNNDVVRTGIGKQISPSLLHSTIGTGLVGEFIVSHVYVS